MKNKMYSSRIIVVMAFLIGGVYLLSSNIVPPSNVKPSCVVGAPEFKTWFIPSPAAVPVPLNAVANPANSVTFSNSPNCDFYKWSEHMYLWLTSPAPAVYGGGARIFDSPVFFDVSPPDANHQRTFIPHTPGMIRKFNLRSAQVGPHDLQIIFDKKGRMFEVEPARLGTSGRPLIQDAKGQQVEIGRIDISANNKPVFLDKANKIIAAPKPLIQTRTTAQSPIVQKFMLGKRPLFLDAGGNVIDTEEGQADNGVLEAQNGSLVYYITMVNDVYAYFLTGVKDHAITPGTRFPTTQNDLNQIKAFATAHGKALPDDIALAIELKSSWVEATNLPNLSSYITMKATIPTYNKTNPNTWIPNGQKTVLLAMVGLHVVGSTAGHPEMIWATFEHQNNAPNATFSYINVNNQTQTVTQNTAGNWLFCANSAVAPFNMEHMQFVSPNIQSLPPFQITASNTLRQKAWGAATDASPNPLDASAAASNSEIISINNSILGMLNSGDVRKNYLMTGSTWTIGGAAPTGSFPSGNEVGTSKLANTTMETYQQGSNTLVATGTNCFSCHVTNTTSVSHVFNALKPLF